MDELPENIACSNTIVFSVSQPLSRFLNFVESQLEYQINQNLEQLSYHLFFEMLGEQRLFKQIDHRIREAVEYIEAHLTDELPINELARVACLSPTQFKKLFKEQTGLTAIQYIIKLRMEKAQALLIHTDYPNQIVAEKVGYKDYSAFSRRFSQHFGLPPSRISR
ncbi:helix-turn-helix domain-containing protein [Endozoicomonadaceae bacterium StTr2]